MLLLCGLPGATSLLYVFGKLAHRFFGDDAALASGKLGFGHIHLRQNFCAGSFTFFPQGKSFVRGFFQTVQPAGFDGLPD